MKASLVQLALCACTAALASCAGFGSHKNDDSAQDATGPGYNRFLQDPSSQQPSGPEKPDPGAPVVTNPENPSAQPPPNSDTTPPAGNPPTPPPPASQYPYGKPVPGKKGFVTSPYDEKAGMIDVRDYAPGTKVRDPYTNKIFLVP